MTGRFIYSFSRFLREPNALKLLVAMSLWTNFPSYSALPDDCDDIIRGVSNVHEEALLSYDELPSPFRKASHIDSENMSALMRQARLGNADAQSLIIEALYQVVPRQLKAANSRLEPEEVEELTQRILMRVVEDGYNYDFNLGNDGRTSQYANWMKWHIMRVLRKSGDDKFSRNESSFNTSSSDAGADETGPSIFDMRTSDRSEVNAHEIVASQSELIREVLLPTMNARDRRVIEFHLDPNVTAKQAAVMLGVTPTTMTSYRKKAFENLATRTELQSDPKFGVLFAALKDVPSNIKDAYAMVAFDGYTVSGAAMRAQTSSQEIANAYVAAVRLMGESVKNKSKAEQVEFWNQILDLPGVHQEAAKFIVNEYEKTGEFPSEASLPKVISFSGYEMPARKLLGIGYYRAGREDSAPGVFYGGRHVFWVVARELAKVRNECLGCDLSSASPLERRALEFNPFLFEGSSQTIRSQALLEDGFEKFRQAQQERVLDEVINFHLKHGRLPKADGELAILTQLSRNQIFGQATYREGQKNSGMHLFKGPNEYEQMIHIRALTRMRQLMKLSPQGRDSARAQALASLAYHADYSRFDPDSVSRKRGDSFGTELKELFDSLSSKQKNLMHLRFEAKRDRESVAAIMGLTTKEVTEREANLFAAIRLRLNNQRASAERRLKVASELQKVTSLQSEMVDALVDHIEQSKTPILSADLDSITEANAAKILGDIAKPRRNSLFMGPIHRLWLVYEEVKSRRQALEGNWGSLSHSELKRLKALQSFSLYSEELGTIQDNSISQKVDSLARQDVKRELDRLADRAIDDYLTKGSMPSVAYLSRLESSSTQLLTSPKSGSSRPRFQSYEHYYSELKDRITHRLADPQYSLTTRQREKLERLQSLISEMPGHSMESYLIVGEQGRSWSYAAKRIGGRTKTERIVVNDYLIALNHKTRDFEDNNRDLVSFWESQVDQNGLVRDAAEALADWYLETGIYPADMDPNSSIKIENRNFRLARVLGMGMYAPIHGPERARIFHGQNHALWAISKIMREKLNACEACRKVAFDELTERQKRLVRFSPHFASNSKSKSAHYNFAKLAYNDWMADSQRIAVDVELDHLVKMGKRMDPSSELPKTLGIEVKRLFGYGAQYKEGGEETGAHVFLGLPAFEAQLTESAQKRLDQESSNLSPQERENLQKIVQSNVLVNLAAGAGAAVAREGFGLATPSLPIGRIVGGVANKAHYDSSSDNGLLLSDSVVTRLKAKYGLSVTDVVKARLEQGTPRSELSTKYKISEDVVAKIELEAVKSLLKDSEDIFSVTEKLSKVPNIIDEQLDKIIASMVRRNRPLTEGEMVQIAAKHYQKQYGIEPAKTYQNYFRSKNQRMWLLHRRIVKQRQELEDKLVQKGKLSQAEKKRLLFLRQFTLHQIILGKGNDVFGQKLIKERSLERERELDHILDVVLDEYLETGKTPSVSRAAQQNGFSVSNFLNGKEAKEGSPRYFDSANDFYQKLVTRAQNRANDSLRNPPEEEVTKLGQIQTKLSLDGKLEDSSGVLPGKRSRSKKTMNESGGKATDSQNQDASSVPIGFEGRFENLTRVQQLVVSDRVKGTSFEDIARNIGKTESETIDIFLRGMNEGYNRGSKDEGAVEEYLRLGIEMESPQKQITMLLVDEFAKTGKYPTEASIDSLVKTMYPHMSSDQVLGIGKFKNQDGGGSSRVFYGESHLLWAFEREVNKRVQTQVKGEDEHLSAFTPFPMPWMVYKKSSVGRIVLPLTSSYRDKEQTRVKGIFKKLKESLGRDPTIEEVARVAQLAPEQMVGRGKFRKNQTQMERAVFINPQSYKKSTQQ